MREEVENYRDADFDNGGQCLIINIELLPFGLRFGR